MWDKNNSKIQCVRLLAQNADTRKLTIDDIEYLFDAGSKSRGTQMHALRELRDQYTLETPLESLLYYIAVRASKFEFTPCDNVKSITAGESLDCIAAHYLGLADAKISKNYPFPFHFKSGPLYTSKELLFLSYFETCLREDGEDLSRNIKISWKSVPNNVQYDIDGHRTLTDLHFLHKGSMFDATDASIVDFACQIPGGGVLRSGMVQEEILCLEFIELLIVVLLYSGRRMNPNEVVIVENVRRYSLTSGYGCNTRFKASLNSEPIILRNVIMMDATNNRNRKDQQYNATNVHRELKKCYSGFINDVTSKSSDKKPSIATGRWGCGVYGGDARLKLYIQWIGATLANKSLIWYNFGDKDGQLLESIVERMKGRSLRDLWTMMTEYSKEMGGKGW